MSLAILSNDVQSQEYVLTNVMLAILRSKLYCVVNDNALKSDGKIADIDIRRYFGTKEYDYEYFLMDIHNKSWSMNIYEHNVFQKNAISFYLLAGTDNAPSKLSYMFSLSYLRICPEHLICIYDWIFTLEDIEYIENNGGWYETWYQNIK